MKILYVALSMRGMGDIIDGGRDDRGLPSFVYPLKAFIKNGHEVKIILISSHRKPINIKVGWLRNEDVIYNSNVDIVSGNQVRRLINKTKESMKLCEVINKELKKGNYDFVYCHGKAALFGNIIANIRHVPCGYRIYGTMDMYSMIKRKGIIYTILKYPSYFVLFNIKKEFMLITDDGSRGDYVVNRIRIKDNYDVYNWKNGVDRNFDNIERSHLDLPQKSFLFTAGRVCVPKRQHKSIEVLNALVRSGHDLDLVIAGPLVDIDYYKRLKEMAKKMDIEERVHFLGDVPRDLMQRYAHESIAVLLFARSSNLSNVFIECGMVGSVIITYNEMPLQEFISDGVSGFFVYHSIDSVKIIEKILSKNKMELDELKKKIRMTMDEKMLTWDERCEKEIALVQRYAANG